MLRSTLLLLISTPLFGWGDAGHDIVTRTAVRLTKVKLERSKEVGLLEPLIRKEHMLAHVSNVPDIVWRNDPTSKEDQAIGAKTHYTDFEKFLKKNERCTGLSLNKDQVAKRLKQGNVENEVGTAVWRTEQFYNALKDDFENVAKTSSSDKKAFNAAVDASLVNAGLLSHFIGDLSQPLHTSDDYDGWKQLQGGLHYYFETLLIDASKLDLAQKVFEYALDNKPYERKLQQFVQPKRTGFPLEVSFALSCNSFIAVDELFRRDKSLAVITPSSKAEQGKQAARRSPDDVAPKFNNFLVERLAFGADALSELWIQAWREAKKPNMSQYASYTYATAPKFIPPNY